MIENTLEALNELSNYDLVDAYSKDEPHDIISEIADSKVDTYTKDLLEWVSGNYFYVEDAIAEFGHPTDDKGNPDFIKSIMYGQFHANEQILWDAWRELKAELDDLEVEEITEELIQKTIKEL